MAPRVLRDVSAVDTTTRLLGAGLATPVGVAPTAFHRMAHAEGELATAAGAAGAGALYVLSSRSSRRIEDVGAMIAAGGGTWWFQVYVMRDRGLTAGLVRRAAGAGASALVLTGDTPVVGRRWPGGQGRPPVSDGDFLANLGPLNDLGAAEQAADATFTDIGWLMEIGDGLPVVVKGILRPDDALACAAHGAAGVIVSNHGGRQLDGALASASALPVVAAAVRAAAGPAEAGPDGAAQPGAAEAGATKPGTAQTGAAQTGPAQTGPAQTAAAQAVRAQRSVIHLAAVPGDLAGFGVFVDGGIRSGHDVLAALALGADAVFVGRPALWALACGGAEAVRGLLAGLNDDLAHVMALAGAASLADIPAAVMAEPGQSPSRLPGWAR